MELTKFLHDLNQVLLKKGTNKKNRGMFSTFTKSFKKVLDKLESLKFK